MVILEKLFHVDKCTAERFFPPDIFLTKRGRWTKQNELEGPDHQIIIQKCLIYRNLKNELLRTR